MIYVPPLHAELMSTTALTPTHHKSVIRTAATIAVAIAIPAVAPSIATSIGLSTALGGGVLGSTLGSAVVGSALGALAAKVTGQPVGLGALGGAFTGGIGGFAKGGGFSGIMGGTPGMSGNVSGFYPSLETASPVSLGTFTGGELASTAGLSTPSAGAPVFDAFSPYGDPLASAPGAPVFDAFSPYGDSFAPAPGPGETLTGGGVTPNYPSSGNYGSRSAMTPLERAALGGDVGASMGPGPSVNMSPLEIALAGGDVGANIGAAGIPAPKAPGLFDTLGNRLTQGFEKAFNPDRLIEEGLQSAGKYALNQLSESLVDEPPMTAEQKALMADRDWARDEQKRLSGRKEDLADQYIASAGTISPLQRGQQALALDQNRMARANELYMRSINPRNTGAVSTANRQAALQKARLGSSFARGQQQGYDRQLALLTNAAKVLPTGSGVADAAASDLAAAEKRRLAMEQQQKNASRVFGGLFLPTGADTEEEIEKAQKGYS